MKKFNFASYRGASVSSILSSSSSSAPRGLMASWRRAAELRRLHEATVGREISRLASLKPILEKGAIVSLTSSLEDKEFLRVMEENISYNTR